MEPIDFEQLKKQYGEILVLETDDATFIFKKPERPHIKHFYDSIGIESTYETAAALEQDLLIHPTLEDFGAYCLKNPSVVMDLMPALRTWIGAKMIREKKV